MPSLEIPDIVRRKALAEGEPGAAWLTGLDRLTADIASEWGVTVGRTLHGGTEALVLEARTADDREVILKLGVPGSAAGGHEAQVLMAAKGRGYAELIRYDAPRRALLLERLGGQLEHLGWSADTQIEAICATLLEAWRMPPDRAAFINGAEKAASLAVFITDLWAQLDRPCSTRAIETALQFAKRRRHAHDPAIAVLAHGDAHAANTLLVVGSDPPRFKFVDPDGLVVERAYDLGICMREWSAELLAGDAFVLGRRRLALLSRLTGVALQPIWEWGFIERVSTGLLVKQLGMEDLAAEMLAVADAWAEAR